MVIGKSKYNVQTKNMLQPNMLRISQNTAVSELRCVWISHFLGPTHVGSLGSDYSTLGIWCLFALAWIRIKDPRDPRNLSWPDGWDTLHYGTGVTYFQSPEYTYESYELNCQTYLLGDLKYVVAQTPTTSFRGFLILEFKLILKHPEYL